MPNVLIVVEEESDMLGAALKQAILTSSITRRPQDLSDSKKSSSQFETAAQAHSHVEIETSARLQQTLTEDKTFSDDTLVCPLTLDLPDFLEFPQRLVYQDCRDVLGLQQRVDRELQSPTGVGSFWLPIVLTSKGALYGEVITAVGAFSYVQPLHLPDRCRQPLYELGQRLLKLISASPATYLMQFGFDGEMVVFDRLFPFPADPAVASLKIQSPNLFVCHWHCLSNIPILDLTIAHTAEYQVFQSS